MDSKQFHIFFLEEAMPFCICTPRSIPFAYRDKLIAKLQPLQDQNIIAPVTEPTAWCAAIVATPKKKTDKIRPCVDLSHFNKYVQRERVTNHPHQHRQWQTLHQTKHPFSPT